MGAGRRGLFALCGLIAFLLTAQSAVAVDPPSPVPPGFPGPEPGGGEVPDRCKFEVGDYGQYIVVLHDWVEDPEAVAREHTERYGGNFIHVYKHALKGYSAQFLPDSATALQVEPTVDYIEIDWLIWGVIAVAGAGPGGSCLLAPPLGPKPSQPLEPEIPLEPEAPAPIQPEPEPAGIGVAIQAPAPAITTSGALVKKVRPPARRCAKRAPKKGKRSGSRCGRCRVCSTPRNKLDIS